MDPAPTTIPTLRIPPSPAVAGCRQCGRCTAGCPKAEPPDLAPRRVIRLLQWGLQTEAARHPFLHRCRQCRRCTVRCPHGVDVSAVLRRLVWERFLVW